MSKCPKCLEGPIGIEGHSDLFAHRLDARHMQFRCKVCGCVWERKGGTGGSLAWAEPSGEQSSGMLLPGRT